MNHFMSSVFRRRENMFKKVLSVILVAVMALSLAACGGSGGGSSAAEKPAESAAASSAEQAPAAEAGKKYKIGISCCLMQNEFFAEQNYYFKQLIEEQYPEFELVSILDANLDPQKDLDNVAVFKSQGIDLLIISLSDFNGAQGIMDAIGNDVPIVFMNRKPLDMSIITPDKYAYVGTSETDMGYVTTQYLIEQLKADGATEINYINLIGELTAQNAIDRSDAMKKAIEDSGLPATCVLEDGCNWDRNEGLQLTQQAIGAGKSVNLIFGGCDEIALGAIEALKATGTDLNTVKVGSVDGIAAAIQSIQDGELDATAGQRADEQAANALAMAKQLLVDGKVAGNNDCTIDPDLITKENVDQFVKK